MPPSLCDAENRVAQCLFCHSWKGK
ncbi:MAG: ribosome silencing factor, partial [Agrobacterium fabrum]